MIGKKNNRDDFTEKIKRNLKLRVGGRCSNPDCRVPTDAPSDEGAEKINSIGEAAHITAAAPGPGARRYNKALKPDERRSVTNGIWLCANCADKIDKDEETYTVALLHEWKRKAEKSAKREQGRKLPAEQDAVNTLVAAATGQSLGFLPNLVPNAIKAESSYWEKIYPRFTVETSYHRGETHRTFYAKEDCKFKIIIKDYCKNEFERKMNESIKHGSVSILDASAVTIPSLPIINEPLDCSYSYETIEFIPLPRRKVIIRIQAVSPDSGIEQFYDIDGHLFAGTESITAEGR